MSKLTLLAVLFVGRSTGGAATDGIPTCINADPILCSLNWTPASCDTLPGERVREVASLCPVMCGKCIPAVDDGTPYVARLTTTQVTNRHCFDTASIYQCNKMVAKGFCDIAGFTQQCMLTCGVCPEYDSTLPDAQAMVSSVVIDQLAAQAATDTALTTATSGTFSRNSGVAVYPADVSDHTITHIANGGSDGVLFESKGPREDGESEKKEGLHMSWPTAYGLLIGVGCTLALLLVMVLTRNTGSGDDDMERIHADYDAEEAVGLISQRSLLTPTRSSFNASHSPEDGSPYRLRSVFDADGEASKVLVRFEGNFTGPGTWSSQLKEHSSGDSGSGASEEWHSANDENRRYDSDGCESYTSHHSYGSSGTDGDRSPSGSNTMGGGGRVEEFSPAVRQVLQCPIACGECEVCFIERSQIKITRFRSESFSESNQAGGSDAFFFQ